MKAYVVDSAAVRSNLQILKDRAGSAVLWAVLKGDGYGLGLVQMAAICREAGVTHFAVTEVSEVSRLRAGGFQDCDILMLRPTADAQELTQLLNLGAILTVSSQNDAAVLNGVAETLGVQAQVHVKIDTGMGRYGFLPDELDQLLPIFKYMPGLHVTGIYTHLHSAFCNQKATIVQAEAFQGVLDKLHAEGCDTGMAHMLNSAGLLKYPEYAMDGVRVGSAILGRVSVRGNWGLAHIGECQATIEELRWLPKGHSCGYGAGWTAKNPPAWPFFRGLVPRVRRGDGKRSVPFPRLPARRSAESEADGLQKAYLCNGKREKVPRAGPYRHAAHVRGRDEASMRGRRHCGF